MPPFAPHRADAPPRYSSEPPLARESGPRVVGHDEDALMQVFVNCGRALLEHCSPSLDEDEKVVIKLSKDFLRITYDTTYKHVRPDGEGLERAWTHFQRVYSFEK
ncbi:hypothetical protein AAF712_015172 [Marasmius tenuissimus]|uniref:Uncharacterized protein n=1 Tax=Marasmius tenuissimus TaxID=585030 RepID=A0ABR2Z9X7_9AGAR